MLSQIINLLYPASCQACGKKSARWDQSICPDCFRAIKKRRPPFCVQCGRQLTNIPLPHNECSDCRKKTPYFDQAFSVFYYDGVLKELVHSFKYKKINCISKEFIESTVVFIKEFGLDKDIDMILPIPMHPAKLFKRETNPSNILAKGIAKKLNITYSGQVLRKTKNTAPQSSLNRAERITNIKQSFSIKKTCARQKNILLVDDLFTTGSTVNECARILKEDGANCVKVITLARGDRLS